MIKLLFVFAFFSHSADVGGATVPANDNCAIAKKAGRACEIDFEGDDLIGELPGPNGSIVSVRRGPQFGSLLRYRDSFNDYVERDAEDI